MKKLSLENKREIDGELTAMAERYIETHGGKADPFLLYVPLTAMHFPSEPSREWQGRSGSGMYADMLMQTDSYVGRIYRAIEKAGIADDTLLSPVGREKLPRDRAAMTLFIWWIFSPPCWTQRAQNCRRTA